MKIIFSDSKSDFVERDARRLLKVHEEKRRDPLVPSVHAAQTTWKCEKCGETFWAAFDSYPSYCSKGCEKEDKMIGF